MIGVGGAISSNKEVGSTHMVSKGIPVPSYHYYHFRPLPKPVSSLPHLKHAVPSFWNVFPSSLPVVLQLMLQVPPQKKPSLGCPSIRCSSVTKHMFWICNGLFSHWPGSFLDQRPHGGHLGVPSPSSTGGIPCMLIEEGNEGRGNDIDGEDNSGERWLTADMEQILSKWLPSLE